VLRQVGSRRGREAVVDEARCGDVLNGDADGLEYDAMARKDFRPAMAYLRTSSAANTGADKDSERRQRAAILAYAKRARIEITDMFYDAAVSGADPVAQRPGFAAMLERIEGNGVRTIVVETANRFARDLMVQEVGYAMLKERGIEIIAADSPASFLDDTPTAKLIRQILGAVAEFEKAMTVAKLRAARDRKRADTGRCEGRKSHAESNPELVHEAKRLRRRSLKGRQKALREISAMLSTRGFVNGKGQPFSPSSIKSMTEKPTR